MENRFTALVKKGSHDYVALCLELDVASSGPTLKKALENLSDAVVEFLAYIHEQGLEKEHFPHPVSVEALREFLGLDQTIREKQSINLRGYALEVASGE